MTKVTLVVVNYRTPGDLHGFLKSYEENQSEALSQLIVANNDPQREDIEVAKLFMEKGVVDLHLFQENLYYSGALNRAAAFSESDVIAFFNADTQLTDGIVDHCYDLLMSNPDYAVVGPAQVSGKGQVTHAGVFGTLEKPMHRGWKSRWTQDYEDTREAVTVSGSAYFVKRSVFDELSECPTYRDLYPDVEGAFLPTTHYYEETWFSYHAQAHGYKVVYTGALQMIHEWHRSSPVGGWAEQQMPISRKMFREMCAHHQIPCD